jgi:acyl carrier protein
MNIHRKIAKAIGGVAKAPVPADENESLFDAGVIDSFGLMDLIQTLETDLGIKVPDEDLTPRRFETVAKIEAYFQARLEEPKQRQAGGG